VSSIKWKSYSFCICFSNIHGPLIVFGGFGREVSFSAGMYQDDVTLQHAMLLAISALARLLAYFRGELITVNVVAQEENQT